MTFEAQLVQMIENLEQLILDARDSDNRGIELKGREAIGPLRSALNIARQVYGQELP